MIWQTSSTNSEDTEILGELLGKSLQGGEVIELRSDLGGGKTTFVRGLARGAGSKDAVSSPTFTLSKIYSAKELKIYHYDFYRLHNPGILADQLTEALDDKTAIVVVEWAGVVENVLPEDRLFIKFEMTEQVPDERVITINYPESRRDMISLLKTSWQEIEL